LRHTGNRYRYSAPISGGIDALNALGKNERPSKRRRGQSNARTGVYRTTYHQYLTSLGWKWTPTMFIGQGCKVHLRADELPKGRIVVALSKHIVAVIDGVIHDTDDPSRGGTRCVYGYFQDGNIVGRFRAAVRNLWAHAS
jgi:hypothetical protein